MEEAVAANHGAYCAKVADLGGDGDQAIISNRDFNKPPLEIWEKLLEGKPWGGRKIFLIVL